MKFSEKRFIKHFVQRVKECKEQRIASDGYFELGRLFSDTEWAWQKRKISDSTLIRCTKFINRLKTPKYGIFTLSQHEEFIKWRGEPLCQCDCDVSCDFCEIPF